MRYVILTKVIRKGRAVPALLGHPQVFDRSNVGLAMTSGLDIREYRHDFAGKPADMPTTILNRIKELRLARRWTQRELADAVGVSRQSINSIECNRYVPSLALALSFARVFRCATDEIFTLKGKL